MNKIFSFFLLLSLSFVQAQELNCIIKVNAEKIGGTNTQVYKTLEKSLTDFVNKTDWTGQVYKPNEKINCSMVINISAYESDNFTATIQVQSSRPVFNSTYSSSVFNYNDKDFNFKYTEFQNLTFNPNSFDSNLVSVMAFYSYIIIGMDADTFSLNGGTSSFETAQEIANVAQAGGYKGWSQGDGNQNRYHLVNNILSGTYSPFREAMAQYHLEGLDVMNSDLKTAKLKIKSAISTLGKLHSVRPNAFLTRIFFDAKSDEIVSIFTGGPSISIDDLVYILNNISPLNSTKWAEIR
ncbi:type IX secretion system protein PorD [Flavobacterium psychrotolerans]|uniref:DUF4835 domain-containing protein n=1 Tax=Flavobacterium psychrotolerans TaxID=2169410 RepID=A0A2U1JMG1_9FLAO|nr:DUF4835 family protein [Flavobacterium psychrotolerans]PWA06169.1 DUF4835 domain-containing protein [Flavobacterium psychrotolerans]